MQHLSLEVVAGDRGLVHWGQHSGVAVDGSTVSLRGRGHFGGHGSDTITYEGLF